MPISALQGHDIPAQGNALGKEIQKDLSPVRAKHSNRYPPRDRLTIATIMILWDVIERKFQNRWSFDGGLFRPYRARDFIIRDSQGVALGWYIRPFQGRDRKIVNPIEQTEQSHLECKLELA